ncbi:RNA exonuclease ngl2 [Actinomortierella wolfii]|nr:RNA exonuclease ngl2 [Actinomortierella wolfii]
MLDFVDYTRIFEPAMRHSGYSGYYIKRTGTEKLDGCALFYRRDQVQAVTIKGVEFRRNAYSQRENVGIVALLDIKDGLIKLAQIRYLLDVARATVAAEDEDVPTTGVQLTSLPENCMSGQEGHWDKTRVQRCNVDSVQSFEKAFAEPSVEEAQIGQEFFTKNQDQLMKQTAACATVTQTDDNAQQPLDSTSTSASVEMSATFFNPRMSARMFLSQMKSTTVASVASTFGYLPQHFEFESAYWDRRWKHGSVQARDRTLIIESEEKTQSTQVEPVVRDKHCRNGWTTHHGRCQAVCDYIFYGHLRAEARIKTRQDLFCLGFHQANPSNKTSVEFDDQERDQEPRFRTKLVPAAILGLPCTLVKSIPHYRGLPNDEFGSDHLSLVTKFRFEDEQTTTGKQFTPAQVESALKRHHHEWTYDTPVLPEAPNPIVPKFPRPYGRNRHEQYHSRNTPVRRHDRDSQHGRQQSGEHMSHGSKHGGDNKGNHERGTGRRGHNQKHRSPSSHSHTKHSQ